MKKAGFVLLFIVAILLFSGCPFNNNNKYPTGIFPEQATNFVDVNSSYDDYNAALPETHIGHKLIFSSNRNSQGGNFDIIEENMHITWFIETGELMIDNTIFNDYDNILQQLLQPINTGGNEFGPLSIQYRKNDDQGTYQLTELISYSTDEYTENFASYFVYSQRNNQDDSIVVSAPQELHIINANTNAQYLTFFGENTFSINTYEFDPTSLQAVYFQADTNGQADIFKIDIPKNNDFIEFLSADTNYPAQIVEVLSSNSNDKCPFVNGQTMVFTSDRLGGFGGYDLYYTLYENGQWREPVNFGEKINSAYDEFRPVTLFASGFHSDLLIFSSNRPEGQGGFDIYYAALPFKVFDWSWMND